LRKSHASMNSQAATYKTTNYGTKIKNHPEPAYVSTFGAFRRIAHHDGTCEHESACISVRCGRDTLGRPQEPSANPKKSTREDGESQIVSMRIAQKGRDVDAISKAPDA